MKANPHPLSTRRNSRRHDGADHIALLLARRGQLAREAATHGEDGRSREVIHLECGGVPGVQFREPVSEVRHQLLQFGLMRLRLSLYQELIRSAYGRKEGESHGGGVDQASRVVDQVISSVGATEHNCYPVSSNI